MSERVKDWAIAVAIGAAYLAFAAWNIDQPGRLVFDEELHVLASVDWLLGRQISDSAHPPMTRIITAIALTLGPGPLEFKAVTDHPEAAFYWRFPAAIAGAVALMLTYALARLLGLPRLAAGCAAALLGLDNCFHLHARMAMTNAYATAFALATSVFTALAIRRDRPAWLWAAGVALGLTVATRWTGALAGVGLTAVLVWHAWERRQLWRWARVAAPAFAVVPLAVYVGVFFFWGYDSLASIWAQNKLVYLFHQHGIGSHPYSSPWWTWPAMYKPQSYGFVILRAQDAVLSMSTLGNPALWWASVPALVLAAARYGPSGRFVALMGAAMWLPWALTGRGTTFMVYYMEVLPYAAIALAMVLPALAAVAWTAVAAGLFFYFLPLQTFQALPIDAYAQRMWFQGWEAMRVEHAYREEHGLLQDRAWRAFLESMGNERLRKGRKHKRLLPEPPAPAPATRR